MVKIKRLVLILLACVFLTSCRVNAKTIDKTERFFFEGNYNIVHLKTSDKKSDFMNGIWVSQFDMHPIFRDGNKQRDINDYTQKIGTMLENLIEDGFNTVFLQVRPNGDSMFESEIYPNSKYISGIYGGDIEYDAIKIFLELAKENRISVHAWINPFRLCYEGELINYEKGIFYEWYLEGIGKRIEIGNNGILYLDPSYPEVSDLICDGVEEILENYDFDGIHIDDYFYPTEFEFNDREEFSSSGYETLSEFRTENINRTVKAIYSTVHSFENKVFGISPAGNIYSLKEGWYVDIYRWCEEDGFTDYILPQLYFGFENQTCPFNKILEDWTVAVKNEKIKLYIGLSAAKCALGTEGVADIYAGDEGKFEWRDNKDVLARSLELILTNARANGVCIFSYSSFYDPLNGEDNILTQEEKAAFTAAFLFMQFGIGL